MLLRGFRNYFGKANLENSFSCKSKGTSSNSTHCNQLSSKMSWYQLWCINYYKFGLLVSQKLFVYLANKLFHNFHKNHFIFHHSYLGNTREILCLHKKSVNVLIQLFRKNFILMSWTMESTKQRAESIQRLLQPFKY